MSARAWAAFAAVSVLWGIPFALIRVAVLHGFTPAAVAWARVVIAAAVLLTLAWRAGALASLRGRLRLLAAYALAEIAVPFPLIGFGEQRVSSSLAAIVIASTPLFVAVLALRFDAHERADRVRLTGLLIGLAGVVALVGIDVAGRADELIGALAILAAAFCYAISPILFQRHLTALDLRASMGASLVLAALMLTPLVALDRPASVPTASAVLAVLGLGLLCTAAALVLYGILIAEAGPSRAVVITYLNPVVAIALGTTVLGEHPGAGAAAGLPLILLGSWLATDSRVPSGLQALLSCRRSTHTAGERNAPPSDWQLEASGRGCLQLRGRTFGRSRARLERVYCRYRSRGARNTG